MIGRPGPAHQLQRAEIGRNEAEASDPCRHLAAGHEEFLAGIRGALQVEADEDDDREVDRDDQYIDRIEMGQRPASRIGGQNKAEL